MNYGIPTSVTINGTDYEIRSDFRVILEIIEMLNDPDLDQRDKGECLLTMFYLHAEQLKPADIEQAVAECYRFIDMDDSHPKKKSARIVDWEQDFNYIIAPVNRVLGFEARACEYLHWWTFMGAYMEIGGDCLFSQIVNIRDKQARGEKLEKHERKWLNRNRGLVELKSRFSEKDNEMLKQMLGGG
ncbi:MAG: hypothetical protein KBS60_05815 [Phascolarctobacterium sp.]|nr:hypothetical protein [Candidatus Phascolarctobacterium caballi]